MGVEPFWKALVSHLLSRLIPKRCGAIPCTQLSAEWAAQRIQNLSLPRAVLGHCSGRRGAKNVKSLIEQFHYPRLGPGMLWERTQQLIEQRGGEVRLNTTVMKVLHREGRAIGVVARSKWAR